MRYTLVGLGLIASMLTSTVHAQGAGRSPEYNLAVLAADGYVRPDDVTVIQFAEVLDALQQKCEEPRDRLADFAVGTHQQLVNRGVTDSYLSILQDITTAIPDELVVDAPMKCLDVFAAYVLIRADQ